MPKRLISYGYAAIILGLKVFLAALANSSWSCLYMVWGNG